ncbi:hypothetical protein FOG51_03981 [Hanseniaspora uvarum]|nr:hypothetical protein FOG48_01955 [Hanseniaspora uvarum]KAF0271103.1 hypothetical protein FOG51_03981 [Hanseniaspora uvarum]KAF0276978.1 hypothetical protein FOG50_02168 [Hanseniaspora uvarum]
MPESIININKSLIEKFEKLNELYKSEILPLLKTTKNAVDTQDEALIKDLFYNINVILNDETVLNNSFDINAILHKEIDTSADLNSIEHKLTEKIISNYKSQSYNKDNKYNDLYFEILAVYNSLSNYRFNKNFLPDIVQDILKLKIKYNSENIKQYIQINDLNLLYSKVASNMTEENAVKVQLKLDIEMENFKEKEMKKKLESFDSKSKAMDEINVEERFKSLLDSLDKILQIE